MKIGLRGRLLLALLSTLAATLAFTAARVVVRSEAALEEADAARYSALARQLAQTSRYAVLARSEALLAAPLDELARFPDLVRVEVLDDREALIAARDGAAAGAKTSFTVDAPVRTATAAPGDDAGELAAFGLGGEPQVIGRVVLRFSRGSTARIQAELRRDIITSFLLFGAIGSMLVLALASSVVRRIQALTAAAERVQRGDFKATVDVQGGDEIASLARDFNSMTASLEQQRRALDEAAVALAEKESLAAIGRATAVIAHELKNPLGILLGAAEVASNPARPEAARTQAAKMLAGEVRRLESTLSGLLSYARPRPPVRARLDLGDLLSRARERATHPGGPAAATEVAIGGGTGGAAVLADEQQVSQILLNLLTNSAQAGAKRIRLRVEPGEASWVVHVEDDGPGIDPAVSSDLFLPFVTTKQRGAGLGLAGSRRMARDNGGDLRVAPAEGADLRGAHLVLELERIK